MSTTGKKRARVVGYVRVSTEEQAREGYSLEAQKRAIEGYAKSQGWRIEQWYVDKGKSAYQLSKSRPAYNELMAEIDSWDIVVAKWLNRFWRRVHQALDFANTLERADKEFVCVRDRIDTSSAMGRAQMQLMMVFAELESGQTSERVKDAFSQKLRQSDTWLTRAPLGYDLVSKHLVVNEEEAEVVRRIFELAKTRPQRLVAVDMNVLGYHSKATPKYPEGRPFTQITIGYIISNPTYAGYIHDKEKGVLRRNGHDAIVSDELFNAIQIAKHSRRGRSNKKPLLVGADEIKVRREYGKKSRTLPTYVPVE